MGKRDLCIALDSAFSGELQVIERGGVVVDVDGGPVPGSARVASGTSIPHVLACVGGAC